MVRRISLLLVLLLWNLYIEKWITPTLRILYTIDRLMTHSGFVLWVSSGSIVYYRSYYEQQQKDNDGKCFGLRYLPNRSNLWDYVYGHPPHPIYPDKIMPEYDYKCNSCKEKITMNVPISSYEDSPQCPYCYALNSTERTYSSDYQPSVKVWGNNIFKSISFDKK